MTSSETVRTITYDDKVVRQFLWASVLWGLIGMLVGLIAALQLSFPSLSFDLPWFTFGRLRPLHTNAVIFALVGNMMFAGIYYSTQRLLKARMASDLLSKFHMWGWQLIILGAAITLPLGITQSKEYSELEWFLDLMVAVVWVGFAVNYFWTLAIRNERNPYVAIWFYISTVVTIPILYIVNNLVWPVSATKSYGFFAGAQDALTQWWYGHNAVAFFLTTPILGLMYYFLPKAADRPIYSYRLSIIHFWALVFLYIWAGPHHLLYTALPDWAQSLGMIFSLMLWAPSWGGMLNGLLTLRGAWHKVRTDPVLKFFVAAVTFYGMATFEGPLLSIKTVNGLAHYTDWIVAHVHVGALGWNGFMAAGMFYFLVPRLFGRPLYSVRLADWHFWIGTFGILIYVTSMWTAGVTQGLMWRALTPEGGLQYPDWTSTVDAIHFMYYARSFGGTLYLIGWVLMMVNLYKTARAGAPVVTTVKVAAPEVLDGVPSTRSLIFSTPVLICVIGLFFLLMLSEGLDIGLSVIAAVGIAAVLVWGAFLLRKGNSWHGLLEGRPLAFSILVAIAILIGGIVELVPGLVIDQKVPRTADGRLAVQPYTALELEGRDVYVKEGCYVCHSQMIRPFADEFLRYGEPSRIEESMFDRPFQWGSKRTGPDLARVGGTRPDVWHWTHMIDPRALSEGSVMPAYPWLRTTKVDVTLTARKIRIMHRLGVPYTEDDIMNARPSYVAQAAQIVDGLITQGIAREEIDPDSELIALIAYLQRLGKNIPVQAPLEGAR